MTTLSPDTVRRIEDAAAALIAAGTLNPTNEQVRQYLGGGSLSHISPVMRAFRARQREQAAEQTAPLPPELAQLLTGQLGLLWQAAVKQAEAGVLAAREQADDDIARAYTKEDSTVEARNEILAFFRQPQVQAAINADVMHEMIQATRLAHSLPPFFKNDGFKEEQEFRMVILPDSPYEGVNFRVNDNGLVPYLIIKAKDKLPLTNIRIGPRSNRAMMMDGISFLLQSRGYTSTRISFTETPFR